MEILNVIDDMGNVIAKKEKDEVYKTGGRHKTVHIWIMNSNKEILMQKRSPEKETYPNLWAISCAGHVRSYEESIGAAVRELREELGIKAKEEDFKYLFTIECERFVDGLDLTTIDDIYLIELEIDIDAAKLQLTELTDLKYVYYEYLEQILNSNDPLYVPKSEEHDKLFEYLRSI